MTRLCKLAVEHPAIASVLMAGDGSEKLRKLTPEVGMENSVEKIQYGAKLSGADLVVCVTHGTTTGMIGTVKLLLQ